MKTLLYPVKANYYSMIYVHRCVKVKLAKITDNIWNKATSDCRFNSFGPMVTIISIQVHNDLVDTSYDFGCQRNHFDGKLCVTQILYY